MLPSPKRSSAEQREKYPNRELRKVTEIATPRKTCANTNETMRFAMKRTVAHKAVHSLANNALLASSASWPTGCFVNYMIHSRRPHYNIGCASEAFAHLPTRIGTFGKIQGRHTRHAREGETKVVLDVRNHALFCLRAS